MVKLTKAQRVILTAASAPLAAIGIAGGIASYFNFEAVLQGNKAAALSVVVAGEGATLAAALVMLALTLLGQHTPAPVRAALWLLPAVASTAGGILANTPELKVVMVMAPLAMTVAGEGVTLVARRIITFQTGVDIEQQRRSGLLLWHANRAANGKGLGKRVSKAAVWRLTRKFAETDSQLSVQLGETQRNRIGQGADENLAAVLTGQSDDKAPGRLSKALGRAETPALPVATSQAVTSPSVASTQAPAVSLVKHTAPAPAPAPAPQPVAVPAAQPVAMPQLTEAMAAATAAVQAEPPQLMTVAEVAALKGVAAGTVRSWVHRGKLPVARRDQDGKALFNPLDVSALD